MKEYVSDGNLQIENLPLLVGIKGSTALYELAVDYINNHGQSFQGHCTFNLLLSKNHYSLKKLTPLEKFK